jgi:hypothetical protein
LSPACDGDSSTQEVRRLKRPGHGRKKDMVGRKIELYFSSRRHADENLDDALEI